MAKNKWARRALGAFGRVSVWIAWPIVAGALLSNWLIERYNIRQITMLAIMGAAFAASIAGVIRTARAEAARMERELAEEKTKKEGSNDRNTDRK